MVKHVNGFVGCFHKRSMSKRTEQVISEENCSRANAVSTSPQIHRILCAPLAMDDERIREVTILQNRRRKVGAVVKASAGRKRIAGEETSERRGFPTNPNAEGMFCPV